MFFECIGDKNSNIRIIWLHGWGVDHTTLLPLAKLFFEKENYLLDLPGFGKTQEPDSIYKLEDYVNEVVNFIKNLGKKTTLIVGHSFGARIAIKLSANYKDLIDGVVIISGAGLTYKRNIFSRMYFKIIKIISPVIKKIFPFVVKFNIGSKDYRRINRKMKEIFKKIINEDLGSEAKKIELPVLLIYGDKDKSTPYYFGEKYQNYIKNSEIYKITNGTHFSVLFEHNKQTQLFIKNFLKEKIK